jgi:hypothetical protein
MKAKPSTKAGAITTLGRMFSMVFIVVISKWSGE